MKQGSTPTHTFNVNIDTSVISKVRVTYAQFGAIILSKETQNCTITKGSVAVSLTQEETLKFKANTPVRIQLHILTTNGEALVTDEITVSCDKLLSGKVLR